MQTRKQMVWSASVWHKGLERMLSQTAGESQGPNHVWQLYKRSSPEKGVDVL